MPVLGMSVLHGWSGCNVAEASPPFVVSLSAARTTSSSSPETYPWLVVHHYHHVVTGGEVIRDGVPWC